MEKLKNKLQDSNLKYPVLAWYESTTCSQLLLIPSKDKIQDVLRFKQGLRSLAKTIGSIIDIEDIFANAVSGDDSIFHFSVVEFNDERPDWNSLIEEVKNIWTNREQFPYTEEKVKMELLENQKSDMAASLIKTIYSSMLYNLITKALELGITEMLFIGDMIYAEELSKIIETNLPEHMNISLMDL